MKNHCYENYPLWIVLISNLVSISNYIIGAYIISAYGLIYAVIYLLYCLFIEIRLLRNGCVNCYYYGKICGFGKGRLSALFFKKGNKKFNEREISWRNMIPEMLVSILPLIAGIIILIYNFSWTILILIIAIIILSTAGNALVRGYLTCNMCKQRELGCSAEELFNENVK